MPIVPAPFNKNQGSGHRWGGIDLLRGLAMVWMTVFHLCFDLANAGYIHQNFYVDPTWTVQRTCILSLFLLCAGASQALALQRGQSWSAFWRRWAQIVACALAVSIGSWWMFPTSYIYFGVLHGMAVMLVVLRLTAGAGWWLWPMGLLAMLLPAWTAQGMAQGWWPLAFDGRSLNWLGLIHVKPITEDYVPIFPWMGVMWWGAAAMQLVLRRHPHAGETWATHAWLQSLPARAVARLGQWSLRYYMLHQPVLLGLLWCWAAWQG